LHTIVTGSAGFIGAAVATRLLERGDRVTGIDNLNAYYDPTLKHARLARLQASANYTHHAIDIADGEALIRICGEAPPDRVVHLAAQAGVRHSLDAPQEYVQSNLVGFLNLLEALREHGCEHLVYASTSSVYGLNTRMPFSEHHLADHPASFYAATKRSNELMAHAYSHLFALPCTGLRFFTVYGPWGRPDMALFKFTERMLRGEPIELYNHGEHTRDFTYIDDIVEGVVRILDRPAAPDPDFDPAAPDPARSSAPFRLYNIGSDNPCELNRYIEVLEEALGVTADKRLLPMQPGDVADTWADVDDLAEAVDYRPQTPIDVGVRRFVDWYRDFYQVDVGHNRQGVPRP